MITVNRKFAQPFTLMVAIATSFVIAAQPSVSLADSWELRTTYKEVPGTREIESGNSEKAIEISKVYLKQVPPWSKVSVLTNLCIGNIMISDFDQAEQYCDAAVARQNENVVSHNNRGVLRAMQGDYAGAQEDFSFAADNDCDTGCDSSKGNARNLPRHVARRNLERSQTEMLASGEESDTEQFTARKQ